MNLTRKDFLKLSVSIATVAIGTTLIGCGGDAATTNPDLSSSGASCLKYGTQSTIASNHGHEIVVSVADINAAQSKTYDITGGAGHAHSFTISAADYAQLAAGASITHVSTDGNSHTHSITISCAAR